MPERHSWSSSGSHSVIERVAAQNLRPLSLALALYYAALAIGHGYFVEQPAAGWLIPIAAISAALMLVIFSVARDKAVTERANLTIVVMASVAMTNSLAHLHLTGDPKQTSNVAMVILGAGLLFYSRSSMAGFLVVSIAAWLGISQAWPPDSDWVHYAFMLFSATVLATLAIVTRLRALKNLEGMRAAVREAELEARLQELQKAESLGVLAGGVARDINDTLAGVLSNVGAARRDLPHGSSAAALLDAVTDAAEHAIDLARQLLDYSGKERPKTQPVSLPLLVDKIRHRLRASVDSHIDIDIKVTGDVPPIGADPRQIQQVIVNLVLNAAEAIGEKDGRILIHIETITSPTGFQERAAQGGAAPPDRFVQVRVQDDGCGMDSATLSRMFDPFYTTKNAGRGLGLATVSGIVRGHGGVIQVDSRVDEGSCITVLFPTDSAGAAEAEERTDRMQMSDAPVGATILVVDDEMSVRWVARDILRNAGFRVIEAKNGLEAVNNLRTSPSKIDLMLLDSAMPVMTGLQTLQETRDLPVKVILMSGSGDDLSEYATPHVVGYLAKPFTTAQMLEQVQEALRQ